MFAKQNYFGNRIKKLCLYAMLVAVCMVVGFLESLFQLSFIAPGVKIGLSNAVACVLISLGDVKGAFAVNISRILLSALLFGSPVSLLFALCGGVTSLIVMALLNKTGRLSPIGVSSVGGAVHNAAQCAAGVFVIGGGVIYYLPVLLVAGVACGVAVGTLSVPIIQRVRKG